MHSPYSRTDGNTKNLLCNKLCSKIYRNGNSARGLCHVHWQPNAYDPIEMIKGDPNFLDSIITGDESWGFAYNLETKCQSYTPPSKKFWFQKSRIKTMLILFFDSKGVIHHEYVPECQTVNVMFYVPVLDCLCKRVLPVWEQKCGRMESSFFSMIMRVHTLQRLSSCFWLEKEWLSWVTLHIRQI